LESKITALCMFFRVILLTFFLLSASFVLIETEPPREFKQDDLVIKPLVDNEGEPEAFIQDFRVTYSDPGRCTDVSFIEFITDSGHVTLKPINYRISCEIVSWGRATDKEIKLLRRRPLIAVRIENPQSENVRYWIIKDQTALQKLLKL
jgi:hypothetical protein